LLRNKVACGKVLFIMETVKMKISPVNMEDRKTLGIKAGDTVRVWVKIQEKEKIRLQSFEGLVLAKKHGSEPGATFTVRKVSNGVGIERIFPLYSPNIDKIEIIKRAKVRKAKLYYIREKVAREIRRQMRKMKMTSITSVSDSDESEKKIKLAEEEANKVAEEIKEVNEEKNETSAEEEKLAESDEKEKEIKNNEIEKTEKNQE